MPIQCFWNESRDYFELLRCGGLMSHLNRQLGGELVATQIAKPLSCSLEVS